jgi:hypothetical protein
VGEGVEGNPAGVCAGVDFCHPLEGLAVEYHHFALAAVGQIAKLAGVVEGAKVENPSAH